MQLMALFSLIIFSHATWSCPELDLSQLNCRHIGGQVYRIDKLELKDNLLKFNFYGVTIGYELPMQETISGVTSQHYCQNGEVITDEQFQGNFTRSTMYMDGSNLRILGQEIVTSCSGSSEGRACRFTGFNSIDITCTSL